jgi:membrane fusion protein (multidrug efflux system)
MRARSLQAVVLGALLAVSGAPGCKRGVVGAGTAGGKPPAATVELFTVRPETVSDVVDLVGQLEAEESADIRPEIDGLLESVEFVEGQEVSKGAVLFRLRDDEQRARLHEAEAELALAEDVYRRTSQLADRNVTAASQLDRARADLAAARARLEVAQVQLDRMQIHAPFDGVLGVRRVSPGDRVATDTSLVQLHAVARLQLSFVIPEVAVPLAQVGRPLTLTTAPYPGEEFKGEVFFVAPSLDPATRRLQLKAWVPNPDRRLRPGLFANLKLALGERKDALLVPEEAVVYDRQGTYVWRVSQDNVAKRVPVAVGAHRSGRVEITSGLRAGDTVVSAGTHKVTEGAPLQPASPAVAEPPRDQAGTAPVGGG